MTTWAAVVGSQSPLPSVNNTAGFPSATSAAKVRYSFTPLKQFVPNDNITTWPNPLDFIPVKPLPTNGTGGGSTQAGYSV